jgi:hypothetical protein
MIDTFLPFKRFIIRVFFFIIKPCLIYFIPSHVISTPYSHHQDGERERDCIPIGIFHLAPFFETSLLRGLWFHLTRNEVKPRQPNWVIDYDMSGVGSGTFVDFFLAAFFASTKPPNIHIIDMRVHTNSR